ncbi:unnamed protein product [Adineta steineri]|uniref:14-3-3 domain-containing protein n=1 Tax=Adineta steineri TaxID=433720 RepID=A0A813QFU2_9BILA|nr:unnamed protein product [Adineta steineri]CAF3972624.1 unnamed protein product [Adineta steineri]
MEDIFAQASLSYLTNRCDEGFELIYLFFITSSNTRLLTCEEEEVFCLISINIIEQRYKSWIKLNRILTQTDNFLKRQSIENYINQILNEINMYSNKIFFLIEKYLLSERKYFSYKIQGDIHFFLSQISKYEKKLQHFYSSLHFYNQSLEICQENTNEFVSTTYNKALLFILITEEYDIARNLLNKINKINLVLN